MKNHKRGFIGWIVLIVLAGLIGGGVYIYAKRPTSTTRPVTRGQNQVVCSMEAKLCPDGSYVGRSGPNCEFAACPAPVTSSIDIKPVPPGLAFADIPTEPTDKILASWKTYRNDESGFEIKYPPQFVVESAPGLPDRLVMLINPDQHPRPGTDQPRDYVAVFADTERACGRDKMGNVQSPIFDTRWDGVMGGIGRTICFVDKGFIVTAVSMTNMSRAIENNIIGSFRFTK